MSLVSKKQLRIQYLTIHSIRRILATLRKADEFRIDVAKKYSQLLAECLKDPGFNEKLIDLIDYTAFALSPLALENENIRRELNNLLLQVVHDFMRFQQFNPSKSKLKGEEKIAVMAAITKSWQLMSLGYGLNTVAFYLDLLLKRYQLRSKQAKKLLEMIRERGAE